MQSIIERFRDANPGANNGEPSEGGILAGIREHRHEDGLDQDPISTGQLAVQMNDQEQAL